jgi:hypothetical protein
MADSKEIYILMRDLTPTSAEILRRWADRPPGSSFMLDMLGRRENLDRMCVRFSPQCGRYWTQSPDPVGTSNIGFYENNPEAYRMVGPEEFEDALIGEGYNDS